jgi:hypothetical protein
VSQEAGGDKPLLICKALKNSSYQRASQVPCFQILAGDLHRQIYQYCDVQASLQKKIPNTREKAF